ncbi:MAG: NAD(P)/FAD-dependent oxidoreductase [Chloroflexaceae bacterium]|nr:NAD(P)/FAD-dependent oxidoreductase [Chloroflexaceae bacterium]
MAQHSSTIIVGAGAAGLSVAYYLQQRGLPYLILEQQTVGATWLQHYDRLHLHTLKAVSALPGLPLPSHFPAFVSATQFAAYLREYAHHFTMAVHEGVAVHQALWNTGGTTPYWWLTTSAGVFTCETLVVATGIWNTPHRPHLPGQEDFAGALLHANHYYIPNPFEGQRVWWWGRAIAVLRLRLIWQSTVLKPVLLFGMA